MRSICAHLYSHKERSSPYWILNTYKILKLNHTAELSMIDLGQTLHDYHRFFLHEEYLCPSLLPQRAKFPILDFEHIQNSKIKSYCRTVDDRSRPNLARLPSVFFA